MRSNPAQLIYHVAYSYHDGTIRHSLSIYRTHNFEESLDFFRRCEECRVLLKLLGNILYGMYLDYTVFSDKKRDIRKYIHDITDQ
jgi:hypothetical protein